MDNLNTYQDLKRALTPGELMEPYLHTLIFVMFRPSPRGTLYSPREDKEHINMKMCIDMYSLPGICRKRMDKL
jgi:hypothetical protein